MPTLRGEFPVPSLGDFLTGTPSVQEEFGELRWVGAHPDHFDVKNAQILWIGEKNQLPGATEEDRQTVTNELDAMEVVETMERIPDMKEQGGIHDLAVRRWFANGRYRDESHLRGFGVTVAG